MANNNTVKKDYIWNMIGSVCYSVSSFYYLMLVTRICGVTDGGIFALAYSTAQLLLTLGRYGMRTYQATDTAKQYSFIEYGFTRIVTCAGMVFFALPYGVMMRYPQRKLLIFVLVAAMKMVDAVEDVYHGELQRNFQVALMGKMLALRNVFSCVVFGILIVGCRDLVVTCFGTACSSLVFCLAINTAAVKRTCRMGSRFDWKSVGYLFWVCFPIFISTFLSLYLYNIPKYAIDRYMPEEIQTYYSVLFMPSFVITLFSEIITKPMLTTISLSWENNMKQFRQILQKIYILIAAGTVVIVAGGHFIGRRLLEIIYAVDLSAYKMHFIVLLFGGGLSAAVYITYNILISIRFQKCIIAVYLAVTVLMTPLTYLGVERWSVMGAVWSYFITCMMLEIAFGTILVWQVAKKKRSTHDGQDSSVDSML